MIDSFNTSELRELGVEVIHVLSHFHSDHRPGLTKEFRGRLICSPITADLVEGTLGVNRFHLERLPVGTLRTIEPPVGSGLQPFTVLFLDANHCPGSVSIVIRGEGFTHFYMGDCRLDMNVLNAFSRLNLAKIGFLYFDSTFYDKESMWDAMPKKSESIRALLGFIDKYPYKYAFEFELLGTEPLIESILSTFSRENIYVSNEARYRELEIVYASQPRILERLIPPGSRDFESFRFTIINRKDSIPPGYIRVRATTQRWSRHVERTNGDSQKCPVIEYENGTCFLFWSMHSSKREIDSLIELVPQVDHMVPIVPPIDPRRDQVSTESTLNAIRPPLRRVRREAFEPSIADVSWLLTTGDSQETVPVIPEDTPTVSLPFWGHRVQ